MIGVRMRRGATAVAVVGLIGATVAAGGGPAVGAAGSGGEAERGAAAGASTAASSAPTATAARRRVVRVRDDFFSPRRLGVRRGSVLVWRWARANRAVHDVALRRAPRGVKRFRSAPASRGARFARRLKRPGLYRMVCTFHPGMAMRVRVRR